MIKRLPISDRLRKLLLENHGGLTIAEMSKLDGSPQDVITGALYRGYGFYIGGWDRVSSSHLRAIWMVVRVPMRAPKPVGYESIDEAEIIKQRKAIEYRRRKEKEREQLQVARTKLKKQRDEERQRDAEAKFKAKVERETVRMQERMERERRRAEIKAEKAAKEAKRLAELEAPYVPQLTRWQPVKPWPKAGAQA